MANSPLSLPVLPASRQPEWHGLSALAPPEPDLPQGEYAALAAESQLVALSAGIPGSAQPVELLAPAGGPEAAYAAFHYGADAVYLGLKKFSARAEAENFTLEEVAEVAAYAHSLEPRRRVFVTINTVIRQDEMPELIESLVALSRAGVDALIIQDLGVYFLVRQYFPELELHASTQLAVHNRAGADSLHRLGFARVVLARELTFEEVRDITSASGVETEVFIHGALCYSYSGLCLFSSQTLGRSGNRGKCAYSCRDAFQVEGAPGTLRDGSTVKRDPAKGFPFSMKDLALPDHMPALRAAGVSCFKIEGRKKSPLYVATTTDYYRKLLDGNLADEDRAEHEADLQTVFSRPWTRLFVQSHKDKEVADRDTVGHRGAPVGHVEAVVRRRGEPTPRLRFRTTRALERHDGLQIDLPILGKPFGLPVDHLWIEGREVFQADAGTTVEVGLPENHPQVPIGAPIYCSSSQDVKRRYRYERPKPGLYGARVAVDIELAILPDQLLVVGRAPSPCHGEPPVKVRYEIKGPFAPARDATSLQTAARSAFEKLGNTRLSLGSLEVANPENCFVPISKLNRVRREFALELEKALDMASSRRIESISADLAEQPSEVVARPFRWSLKVDRIGSLDGLDEPDWSDIDEFVVDITRDHPSLLQEKLELWRGRLGTERIRLALPALTRKWEERALRLKIDKLRSAGWNKWEAANLSAWSFLGLDPAERSSSIDLATDWSIYVLNRAAGRQLLSMGVSRFALSPEDGLANYRMLLPEFRNRAVVIVYQDTPLFLAESCAYANLIGGCPGKANCRFESMEMVSQHGERVTAIDFHCRTIVLNDTPFCLSSRLPDLAAAGAVMLRADFIYRTYASNVLRDRWRAIRSGQPIRGGHDANFDRGLL
jgi:putative protease